MANAREIQGRMKSIKDTMKITNAMYMVSSSKLQKARRDLKNTEPFFFMMQDGRKNEMNRVFQDETFAKRLFEEYHIGNLIMERKQLCQYTTI